MDETLVSNLSRLANNLYIAKNKEKEATSSRIEIENQIASLLPGKEKGQETTTLPNGIKITIKRGFIYKADLDAIRIITTSCDTPAPIKIKTTKELDVIGYEWYREYRPEIFIRLSNHVEVKNTKPSISVKIND